MSVFRCGTILLIASASFAQNPRPNAAALTAEAIMARVAANQDRSEARRKQYVYKQRIHILTLKSGGKLMREETADYNVAPTPDGTEKKLMLLTGRYWHKGRYERFTGEPTPEEDSFDSDLISDLRDDLSDDTAKDGLARRWFPLTSEEQKGYAFQLLGQEVQRGRSVYHISFQPKEKDETPWAGEAYIDAVEFEPVRVLTKLAGRLPLMIRIVLGIDVPGIGFDVVYQRQPDGVWFPATVGTEFRIRAGFVTNRHVSVSLENSAFQHTHVVSRIKGIGEVE
ncbi:MAG TPA: hypothetical protein VJP02_30570 [Candidatus Sulfotelmatobacter sp.]|nr:hypothetical protein [Candidatus Sulfotelmatobacter sp.]